MVNQMVKWVFEPTHCKIGFSIRHFGISEVEGFFRKFEGTVGTDRHDFSDAAVELTIDAASIDTQEPNRDGHLSSADFFEVEKFPTIHFKSTRFEVVETNQYRMWGELTMRGITKVIPLDVEFGGVLEKDPFGNSKAGFFVSGKINRKDWGITWNTALDLGGVAVSDTVKISCHVQLLKM